MKTLKGRLLPDLSQVRWVVLSLMKHIRKGDLLRGRFSMKVF